MTKTTKKKVSPMLGVISLGIGSKNSAPVTHLIQMEYEKVKLRRKGFYGSDVGHCPRKAVLLVKIPGEFQAKHNSATKLYMAIGEAVHETLQKLMEKAGILVKAEKYLKHWTGVGGYIDAVIWFRNRFSIIEIKTCGNNPPTKPKHSHPYQAGIYSFLTGITDSRILYLSRNVANFAGNLKTSEFKIDKGVIIQSITNLATAVVGRGKNILPPIPPNISSKSNCTFCPFQKSCWQEEEFPVELGIPDKKFFDEVEVINTKLMKEFMERRNEVKEKEKQEREKRGIGINGERTG